MSSSSVTRDDAMDAFFDEDTTQSPPPLPSLPPPLPSLPPPGPVSTTPSSAAPSRPASLFAPPSTMSFQSASSLPPPPVLTQRSPSPSPRSTLHEDSDTISSALPSSQSLGKSTKAPRRGRPQSMRVDRHVASVGTLVVKVLNPNGVTRGAVTIETHNTGRALMEQTLTECFKVKAHCVEFFGLAIPQFEGYDTWVELDQTLRDQGLFGSITMTMKVRLFLPDMQLPDDAAKTLYWLQVMNMVVSGVYLLDEYCLVRLAALFLQICDGDFPKCLRRDRFQRESIVGFMPARMLSTYRDGYWEARLPPVYYSLRGQRRREAVAEYLRIAQRSPLFGATIFRSTDETEKGALAIAYDGVLYGVSQRGLAAAANPLSSAAPSAGSSAPLPNEAEWTFMPWSNVVAFTAVPSSSSSVMSIVVDLKSENHVTFLCSRHMSDAILKLAREYRAVLRDSLQPPPPRPMHHHRFSALELFKLNYWNRLRKQRQDPIDAVVSQVDRAIDNAQVLETLDLTKASFSSSQLRTLCESLLSQVKLRMDGSRLFTVNFRLKKLVLSQNSLDVTSLGCLGELLEQRGTVSSLDLSNCKIQHPDSMALAGILNRATDLHEIVLRSNPLGPMSCEQLVRSSCVRARLTHLDMRECGLKDDHVVLLANSLAEGSCSLRYLNLSHNPIKDDGLKLLSSTLHRRFGAACPLLELVLNRTRVTFTGVKALFELVAAHGKPTSISLRHCKLGSKVGERLAALLIPHPSGVNAPTLESIDLGHTGLDKKGCAAIFTALRFNQSLQSLHVGGNTGDRKTTELLCEALRLNRSLVTLSINGMMLGSDCMRLIANVLRDNIQLKSLHIGGNSISHIEMKLLCNALAHNFNLETLNLSGSHSLAMDGFRELFLAIQCKTIRSITSLILNDCDFGDAEAIMCAEVLNETEVIESLSLEKNHISNTGAMALLRVRNTNRTLKDLNLLQNSLYADPRLRSLVATQRILLPGKLQVSFWLGSDKIASGQ